MGEGFMKRLRSKPKAESPPSPAESKARTTNGEKKGRLADTRRGVFVLTFSLIGLLLLYAAALFFLRPARPGTQVSLNELDSAAKENRVLQAEFLDEDSRVAGLMRTPTDQPLRFWASYPRDGAATNDLLKQLLSSGATVEVNLQTGKALVKFLAQFLLPLVILANLFALLFYLIRGGTSGTDDFTKFGQIGDHLIGESRTTTFANVAATQDQLVELSEVRDYLADPSAFARMGALPPKGILIVGPPGCGKTLMARALAGEAKANFFTISGSEFVESLVGVGAARVRDLFRQAREATPAIIFIDELDAVGRQRGAGLGGGHDEREQTLNELLVQMDGFTPAEGVAILAATNRMDILDPALLRRGRFDRHIVIDRPDVEERLAILQLHAKGKRLADPETDLVAIARHTPGFSGADLASLLNEAALLAVRERSSDVTYAHLEEAVERVVGGPRRRGTIIPPEDKRRIAYHEAGHAVVASALGKAANIEKLSIIARGRGIGHLTLLSDERLLPTRDDMENTIAIAMAGVAAEELALGQPSTGAEADLERATNTARDMAGRYGMSSRLGRVRVLREHQEVFLGRDYLLTRDVSQPTLEHLDGEVRRILDQQESLARQVLDNERRVLDVLASGLVTYETLQGPKLAQVLGSVKPWPTQPVPGGAPAPAAEVTNPSNGRKT
ncbi:MAG: ATP-dependent zinc metalloprotease FtsH [Acidimicrobiales bacterium]